MSFFAKIEARLIAEWRSAWRYWSVKLNGVGVLLLGATETVSGAWNSMPADLRAALPFMQKVALALFIAGLVARFVAQPRTADQIAEKRR